MNRSELITKDFHYDLPEDRIAKFPLTNRNASKLLVRQHGQLITSTFSELQSFLPPQSMIVFNDTKVIAARLIFQKVTGAIIEVFCLEPFEVTVEQALNTTNTCIWKCMVGNLKRFNTDTVLKLDIAGVTLSAAIYEKRDDGVLVKFEWEGGLSFSSILDAAGKVPLPPYLNREIQESDKKSYQTVYAKNQGAVAAPTAGLHFVPQQLSKLQSSGHLLEYLTLFVGAGTFKTVKAEKLVDHAMHQERIVITKSTIEHLAQHQGSIISVGTTSLRSLESLYWLAVKMDQLGSNTFVDVHQSDAYELPHDWGFEEACQFMLGFLNKFNLQEVDFYSALFIMPGYTWKSIDGLITNFHQPGSTLLALIASWIGEDWKQVYDYAMDNDFRFLSYGDSSLLMK